MPTEASSPSVLVLKAASASKSLSRFPRLSDEKRLLRLEIGQPGPDPFDSPLVEREGLGAVAERGDRGRVEVQRPPTAATPRASQ
jgi:hypothetical protein